jgi:7-cyano-7-deazaguanine synthase
VTVILLSGGLDSAACLHLARSQNNSLRGVFVDYGQAAASAEHKAATGIGRLLGIPVDEVVCRGQGSFGTGEILGRNAFLVMAALVYGNLQRGRIGIGIHAGTTYYDCTPAFTDSINRLVAEYSDGKIEVWTPFINLSKARVCDYFALTGIPLEMTYSCEAGTNPPCGTCLSCLDRGAFSCST